MYQHGASLAKVSLDFHVKEVLFGISRGTMLTVFSDLTLDSSLISLIFYLTERNEKDIFTNFFPFPVFSLNLYSSIVQYHLLKLHFGKNGLTDCSVCLCTNEEDVKKKKKTTNYVKNG